MHASPVSREPGSEHARRVLTQATLNAADLLGVSQADLATIIGLSEPTVSRLRHGTVLLDPRQKSWELAALFVRLFRSLDALMGSDDAASRSWLRAENQHLHGVPLALTKTVSGLVRVVSYVDAYRAKL